MVYFISHVKTKDKSGGKEGSRENRRKRGDGRRRGQMEVLGNKVNQIMLCPGTNKLH